MPQELSDPVAILHIRLASGDILDPPWIGKDNFHVVFLDIENAPLPL